MDLKRYLFPLFLAIAGVTAAKAQDQGIKYLVPGKIQGKDTIPYISLPTVEIYGTLTPEDQEALRQYKRLKYNVLKVYPYAKWAAAKFREINEKAEKMKPKERKKYIKDEEKKAKEQFEAELKKLTYSQGKILIKLVDRETGKTSYELVKELRGSFNAFLWQSLAKLFTANLKAHYDSLGEDRAIEQIVRQIERGEIR
jgi:hypothetical protein